MHLKARPLSMYCVLHPPQRASILCNLHMRSYPLYRAVIPLPVLSSDQVRLFTCLECDTPLPSPCARRSRPDIRRSRLSKSPPRIRRRSRMFHSRSRMLIPDSPWRPLSIRLHLVCYPDPCKVRPRMLRIREHVYHVPSPLRNRPQERARIAPRARSFQN